MHLLITGHSGFLGSALTRAFIAAGHRVTGVGRSPDTRSWATHTLTWTELENPGALEGVDLILHLAGIAEDAPDKAGEVDYENVNVGLTRKIYNKYLTSTPRVFLYFSSVKAVSEGSCLPVDEQHPAAPSGPYGRSKRKAEEEILSHLPQGDRRVYLLRPCMVHGAGVKGNLPRLFRYLRKGLPLPVGNHGNRRHYLALGNLIFLVVKLSEAAISAAPPPSGIYHLADDEPISTTQMLRLIGEATGRPTRLISLPGWMMRLMAGTGTLLGLPWNKRVAEKLAGNLVVPNLRIREALQIDRLPVTTEEGFRQTFRDLEKEFAVKGT